MKVFIEGWIHSKMRNRLSQESAEKLLRVNTNLVLRESSDEVDVVLHRLLPWNIELVIDRPIRRPKFLLRVETHT